MENLFDLLPEEMILKVFEHSTSISDRSTLAKVTSLFNRLSKDKLWRKRIIFTESDLPQLLDEAEKSTNLEELIESNEGIMVCINHQYYMCRRSELEIIDVLAQLFTKFGKKLKKFNAHISGENYSFLSARNDLRVNCKNSKMEDLISVCPPVFYSITCENLGENPVLEGFLMRSKHVLVDVRCTNFKVTASSLSTLAACDGLATLCIDRLIAPSEFFDLKPLDNIRYLIIQYFHEEDWVNLFIQREKLCNVFFTKTLKTLAIHEKLIVGVRNILEMCPKLEKLVIIRISDVVDQESTQNLYKKLICSFVEHDYCRDFFVFGFMSENPIIGGEFKAEYLDKLPDNYTIECEYFGKLRITKGPKKSEQ